jgi:hypothetical protein
MNKYTKGTNVNNEVKYVPIMTVDGGAKNVNFTLQPAMRA